MIFGLSCRPTMQCTADLIYIYICGISLYNTYTQLKMCSGNYDGKWEQHYQQHWVRMAIDFTLVFSIGEYGEVYHLFFRFCFFSAYFV